MRLPKTAGGHPDNAFLLVEPLVVADLAEQVGQGIETPVVDPKRRPKRT